MIETAGPTHPPDSDPARDKATRRARTRSARAALSPDQLAAARTRNSRHLLPVLAGSPVICAYLPLRTEPLGPEMLDALRAAGTTVLLPVARPDQPLDWVAAGAGTRVGPFGIEEPIGPLLGVSAPEQAEIMLVPAFAVDRQGVRLGRGGGHYDRSLGTLRRRPQLIAVLHDGELVESMPAEDFDVPVNAAVLPASGVIELPVTRTK